MADIRIGIVGFGKIARDQHRPAILGSPVFRWAGIVSPEPVPDAAVPVFPDIQTMVRETAVDAVAICTPPAPRHRLARHALEAGLHVLLEKPPAATLGEVADLRAAAERAGRTLFAAWHSRFNDSVAKAAAITHREGIATLDIQWLEDVEKWHPGQDWIWQAGGFGVFDPGINALSIATRLCPEPLLVRRAELKMHAFDQQAETVSLVMATGGVETGIGAYFDFRHTKGERWTIDVTTLAGRRIALSCGGTSVSIDGRPPERGSAAEYPAIYAHFADLIACGRRDVDDAPLRIVADALLNGERVR